MPLLTGEGLVKVPLVQILANCPGIYYHVILQINCNNWVNWKGTITAVFTITYIIVLKWLTGQLAEHYSLVKHFDHDWTELGH